MDYDPRDEVWNATWKAYYETYYQELLAEKIVLRWQRFDEFSKVLIALTASTSALSGWSLWNQPNFKILWALFAAIGAILAIIHKSFDVSHKLSEWGSSRSQFCIIRIDFETVQNKMRFEPEFLVEDISMELSLLRKRYGDAYQNTKVDIFLTERFKEKAQNELNTLILSK
jgi:hypothetical protein